VQKETAKGLKDSGPQFGRIALMKGFITEEHLRKALAEQMNSRIPGGGGRRLIGEILFEKGWIKDRQIRIVLDEQRRSAASPEAGRKRALHTRNKGETAGSKGEILAGMTKRQVREILSSSQPRIWYTPGEQEVWFYRIPRKQNIYFTDDKVESVKYLH